MAIMTQLGPYNVVDEEARSAVNNNLPMTVITIPKGRMRGDIDGDGDLDMTDASLVMQYVNGSEMTEKQIAASDVDGDGDVDMTDVSLILQYVNGMITKFPAEA